MSFHTGIHPSKKPSFNYECGNIVWEKANARVSDISGRYYLFLGGHQVATLIGGEKGLAKYHNGSCEHWLESVCAKDEQKIAHLKELTARVHADCDWLEGLWDEYHPNTPIKPSRAGGER